MLYIMLPIKGLIRILQTYIITVHACTQKESHPHDFCMIFIYRPTTQPLSFAHHATILNPWSPIPSSIVSNFGPQPRHQGFAFHGGSQEFRVVLKFCSSSTSNHFEKRAVALRLLLVTKSTTNQPILQP